METEIKPNKVKVIRLKKHSSIASVSNKQSMKETQSRNDQLMQTLEESFKKSFCKNDKSPCLSAKRMLTPGANQRRHLALTFVSRNTRQTPIKEMTSANTHEENIEVDADLMRFEMHWLKQWIAKGNLSYKSKYTDL